MQEDTKTMSSPEPWQAYTYDRLDELRQRWTDAEQAPPEVGPLSSGEYAALALACGHERALASPLVAFVLLDGWLQCWVMQRRGLAHLIGTRIGA
jgi:hypothetical protein